MRPLDWVVLIAALAGIVAYGLWKGRRTRGLEDFLVAERRLPWQRVALSIMATQASAITFLSTPGQAYTDGMRFVQFYFGLPVAMVVLAATAVPIYRRMKVFTAYEYLEGRFDLKTRTFAATLFLIQRGLGAGFTIYAPSLIFSVILGWDIHLIIFLLGGMVTLYTAAGGARAVDNTNFQQMIVIMGGMFVAFLTLVWLLPPDVSFVEALYVAGKSGRLNAVDFSFDPSNQYNFWSGLIGGCFVAMAYFGTDQSQVQRYLGGASVAQSRLGLLFNGVAKVPMQFFILFLGAMVFAFYQFIAPPLFHNPVEVAKVREGPRAAEFRALEEEYAKASAVGGAEARRMVEAARAQDARGEAAASERFLAARARVADVRARAAALMKANDPDANTNDTNYVFLGFVIRYMPAGVVGLVIAAVFFAAMTSSASELNALASTTAVDIHRRLLKRGAADRHYVVASKLLTVFWGLFAVAFAEYAGQLGSLVEAVNRLGSLFYGTLLGIFLLGFYFKRVGGTPVFVGAVMGELVVLYCFYFTKIAYLWFNVIGAVTVITVALFLSIFIKRKK